MRLWRFLLVFALAFGSVLPHCASAAPVSAVTAHHAGTMHDRHSPTNVHAADVCIGCAVPVRATLMAPAAPMAASAPDLALQPVATTRTTVLDPPPPRVRA